jgi:ribosomal protein L21E
MPRFETGDRVRIDIPDETDTDHDAFHGEHGTITDVIEDDAGEITGSESDSRLYRIEVEEGGTHDFRERDLRPPIA